MGYLFLFLSVFSGAVKGFFAKKISNKTSGLKSAVLSNLIRMLFCILIGFIFVAIDGVSFLAVPSTVLWVSIFCGITTSVFIITWLLAVRTSAYTSMDAFLSMGVLIPILLSNFIYHEQIAVSQIIGLALLFLAVILMSSYTNQIKQRLTIPAVLLLIVVSSSSGITDFLQKVFAYNSLSTPASVFNFYVYIFSASTLAIVYLALCVAKKNSALSLEIEAEKERMLDKKKIIYIAIMAIFLFCNSYFKTLSAGLLDAALLYPLSHGTAIILSLTMSTLFFKEKIKPVCILGLIVLFVGLLFINVIIF